MREEPIMSEEDAKQLFALEASINIAKAYCQRCFVEIEREKNRKKCQQELEAIAQIGSPFSDTEYQGILATCQTCDYQTPYVAELLEKV